MGFNSGFKGLNKCVIEKLCVKLVTYQNYTKMHGPKNIKEKATFFILRIFRYSIKMAVVRTFEIGMLRDVVYQHFIQ